MSAGATADTTAAAARKGAPPPALAQRFRALGPGYYAELDPTPLPDPRWVAVSDDCAATLGFPNDWWRRDDWHALDVFSGSRSWPGMRPLASVYSGHQFGVWAGQLGDGRAHLLGEVQAPGGPLELQLKGSGPTPYSRMGDGRAVLRSSIREFLCSEAMHALGVPTTRALCLVASPLPVRRETVETAAVVTRVAPSFLRFGHYEHFAHHDQPERLAALVDFTIAHHYPELAGTARPAAALLSEVARRTAELIAQWQSIGFCHGVMNTDNLSILGLTIDYGPFGFLDGFDPGHVCNHSDHGGRYAYARQPSVAFWNLHALAQALLPLIGDTDTALAALEPYRATFPRALLERFRAKLGLTEVREEDEALVNDWLRLLAAAGTDYTIAFRRLSGFDPAAGAPNEALRDLFVDRAAFDAWAVRYAQRLRTEGGDDGSRRRRMDAVNPRLVLRNHLAEQAIRAAEAGDDSEVRRLHEALRRPFDDDAGTPEDAGFPPAWAAGLSVSCSS